MRKRRNEFLIGLAVAVLTFGGLWFGIGSDHFNRGQKMCKSEHCGMMLHHQNHCSDASETIHAPVANDSIAE